jgi:hypothetical protein
MAVNKNFVVKHGLEVKQDLLYADAQLERVGIGTTLAYHKLHVNGDLKVDDDVQVVGVTSLGTNTKIIDGTLEAGNTGVGTYGQFLIATGAGIAWTTAPNLRKQEIFTALEGQKQFNFAHTIGFLDVFVNGVKLSTAEYTETAAFVTLLNACSVGDTVELIGYYLYDNIGAANTTGIQGITVLEENTITGSPANVTSINFVGAHVTAAGTGAGVTVTFLGAGVGIASSGFQIGYGITNINFIGAGNTFQVNGQSIDVSINSGGNTFWSKDTTYSSGIVTTGRVGIGSTLPITEEGLDTRGVVKTDSLFATKKTLEKDVETFAGYNMFAAGSLAIGAGNSITVVDDATLTILDVIETPVNATLGIFRNNTNVGYGITKLNFTGANNFVTQASATAIDIEIDSGVGIYSGGQPIAFGITALNFVGAANTFGVDGGQINISINSGSGGKFADNPTGIHTVSRVGIGSTIPNTGAALDVDGIIKTHTFFANKAVVEQDVTTIAGYNMFGAGPITVADGKVINIIDESTLSVLDSYSVPSGTRWSRNSTGIHTSLNVGIGTSTADGAADPNNTFILNAGIVTANYFYGDGRFLRNVGVAVSTSAPSNPEDGNLWWSEVLGRGFIYYNAANAWVDFAPGSGGGGGTLAVSGSGTLFSTNQTLTGIHTTSTVVGLGTTAPRFQLEVGPVGAAGTSLWVNGNARVTGILTVGTGSIVLDGNKNEITIGAGVTIDAGGTRIGILTANDALNVGTAVTMTAGGVVAGLGTITNFNATHVNVTGVTTTSALDVGAGITVNSGGFNVTGVVTSSYLVATKGIVVNAGVVTAYAFVGDGSGLTNITAQSTGINIKDNGVNIASGIGTIDFAGGLSVTDLVAGIVTVTTQEQWQTTAAGINTLGSVGIGTTNPTYSLTVTGSGTSTSQLSVTGISTLTHVVVGSAVTITSGGIVAGLSTVNYLDVTGLNATGIITANQAVVGSAVTLTSGGVVAGLGTINYLEATHLNAAGVVTASSFVGDGSGLTGVTAVGTGVSVFDNDAFVGVASALNFGSNLSVSAVAAGVVTVTAQGGAGYWSNEQTNAGIHTTSTFVGIGTTNPIGLLQVGDESSQPFLITTNGSVGVGTTNPDYTLTVTGSGTSTSQLSVTGVSTFADDVIFGGGTEINSAGELSLQNLSRIMLGFGGGTPNGLVIRQNSSSNVSEIVNVGGDDIQIQADSGRSVLIGNDNDTDALKVNNTGVLIAGVTTTTGLVVGTAGTVINALATGSVGIATTNPVSTFQVERFGTQTGFGTFAASAGITTFIDSFTISSTDFRTAEYTVHLESASSIQAQKVLVMQNGSTAYSQEWAVMSHPDLLVSIGATVTGGAVRLNVTPETGVTGIITYRFTRNAML